MDSHRHTLSPEVLLDLLESQRIGAEYQPIKATKTLETAGHEALARFYNPNCEALPPQQVFDALHDSRVTLIQVELMSKRWQISQAPLGDMLFLNLDPHAMSGLSKEQRHHPLLEMIDRPQQTIIELIENTNIQEADQCLLLAEILAQRGIRTALDDIGAPGTMVAMPILSVVDFYKFDRQWLRTISDPRQKRLLQMLLAFARDEGKQTILEGIETEHDLALARELGVDYVQGYLFRPEFITRRV